MFNRKKFIYDVVLQSAKGGTVETVFECYWSPKWEGVLDAVKDSAAAQAWYESAPHDAAQRIGHAGISAQVRA